VGKLKARLLDGWLGDRFLRELQVDALRPFGERFVEIRLSGASLRDKPPSPGDKVQIHVPDAGSRTFSPYGLDASTARCSLLAHVQAASPAAHWLRRLTPGARVRWFGPSRSLELAGLAGPLALFGDETSFGVASAARQLEPGTVVRLELSEPLADAVEVAAALGFAPECLIEKQAGAAHLPAIARVLAEATARGGTIVLTGRARSIQAMRDLLKNVAPGRRQAVKAYWAEGKEGLD
jgi:NADPH-dependent ferric siderophore reductase